MNEYSNDKPLYHHEILNVLRNGEQPNPVHVLLIISDLCSHDCSFCAYRMTGHPANLLFGETNKLTGSVNNNPKRMIPREKVIEILDDCKEMGVKAIEFTGGGEPTVHPQHADLFEATLNRGLELALVTHGVLLSDRTIELLTRARWVRVSLDAGSPETYARIRGVSASQFERALKSIEKLVAAKSFCMSDTTIGISFVVTRENYREIVDAARRAKSLGVDTFRISAVFQPEGMAYFDSISEEISSECAEAEQFGDEGFRVINLWPRRASDLAMGTPDYRDCFYQQFTTLIGGDQNVYRCCNTSYNPRGLIGALKSQRFIQLWNSEEKKQKFRDFDARGCSMCHVNGRNRAIATAIEIPRHVNFV